MMCTYICINARVHVHIIASTHRCPWFLKVFSAQAPRKGQNLWFPLQGKSDALMDHGEWPKPWQDLTAAAVFSEKPRELMGGFPKKSGFPWPHGRIWPDMASLVSHGVFLERRFVHRCIAPSLFLFPAAAAWFWLVPCLRKHSCEPEPLERGRARAKKMCIACIRYTSRRAPAF